MCQDNVTSGKRMQNKKEKKEKTTLLPPDDSNLTRTTHILIWIGLIVANLQQLVSGSVFAANLYLNDLKSTFNYTQTEVEVIVSAMNLGRGLAVLAGIICDRFGPEVVSAVATILFATSYFLIWSTTNVTHFYSKNVVLMIFYFFVAGLGTAFSLVATQKPTLVNFDSKWRGKIIGVQEALFVVSPVMFSVIYYNLFDVPKKGNTETTSHYDLPSYMLMLAITFSVTGLLCLIFAHNYKSQHTIYEEVIDKFPKKANEGISQHKAHRNVSPSISEYKLPSSDENNTSGNRQNHKSDDMTFLDVLRNPHYSIYLVTFVFLGSVDSVVMNNLTSASRSLGFNEHDFITVPLLSITSFCSAIVAGVVADICKTKRHYLQLIATVFGCLGLLLCLFVGNILTMFIFSSAIMGLPNGILWVTVPTEICDRFGTNNYGRNWGFLRGLQNIVNIGVHYVFGYLYELNVPDGSNYCYGFHCIRNSYLFLLLLTVMSSVIFIYRCIQVHRNKM